MMFFDDIIWNYMNRLANISPDVIICEEGKYMWIGDWYSIIKITKEDYNFCRKEISNWGRVHERDIELEKINKLLKDVPDEKDTVKFTDIILDIPAVHLARVYIASNEVGVYSTEFDCIGHKSGLEFRSKGNKRTIYGFYGLKNKEVRVMFMPLCVDQDEIKSQINKLVNELEQLKEAE